MRDRSTSKASHLMGMAWIGEWQHQGADVHSCHQRENRRKRHVAIVRRLIISPAYVHADLVARNVTQRLIDGRNDAFDETEKFRQRTILIGNVVFQREIRAVKLKQKALCNYGFILDLQGAADGGEIGGLGVVVFVADSGHNDAGRWRGEKRFHEPALADRRAGIQDFAEVSAFTLYLRGTRV